MRWLFHYDKWCNIGRVPLIYNTIDKVFELKRLFFNAIKIKYLSLSKMGECDIPLCSDQGFYSKKKKKTQKEFHRDRV